MQRRSFLLALTLVSAAALAQPAAVNPPKSLVCLGDSITFGYGSGSSLADSSGNWCSGSKTAVSSHLTRLKQLSSAVAYQNWAVPGAKMRDLVGEVGQITGTPDYVVILMGANDACASSETAMTSVAQYRASFDAALAALSRQYPAARLYVLSVPNVYRLWEVFWQNSAAVAAWGTQTCQSMLASPQDLGTDAQARRERVRQRIIDYNTALKEVCAGYLHCRYDEGAVFNFDFTTEAVWTGDYFHPSVAGQAQLATRSWEAGFDFSDREIPLSHAQVDGDGGVVLVATDDVAPRGVEYFLASDAGTWTRYAEPLFLPSTDTVLYRGVDVNGNTENTRSFNATTGDDGGVRDAGGGGGGVIVIPPGGGNAPPLEGGGCNCGVVDGSSALVAAGLIGLALRRRRRS